VWVGLALKSPQSNTSEILAKRSTAAALLWGAWERLEKPKQETEIRGKRKLIRDEIGERTGAVCGMASCIQLMRGGRRYFKSSTKGTDPFLTKNGGTGGQP